MNRFNQILPLIGKVLILRDSYSKYMGYQNYYEMNSEKTIEETVLKSSKTSGASNLNEATVYQNPQISRMLDIIGKIK